MSTEVAYRSRSTKARKVRRTRADMGNIRAAIVRILEAENPMTVRQVFYQLVGHGAIAKTESEYKQTVVRLLTKMRREGAIPFGWITDNTRWQRKPVSHSSLESALVRTAEAYRRSLWDTQSVYVEIWLEKDALAGVLYQETEKWDVPLMTTRGYSSVSFLYDAAETIDAIGKPAYIYYFGDYDPSGMDITRAVEKGLREFAPDAEIHFQRVAVTPRQIDEWALPTRPTKKKDSRAKKFIGESVELDAVPSSTLRTLVEMCIEQHVDRDALKVLRIAEESERGVLGQLLSIYREAIA